MKAFILIIISLGALLISACDSQPEEQTALSDYKQQQLDKAKKVEQEMNKRIENIDQQLDQSTTQEDDDTQ
ncbi:hypothetical protein [Kangiella sediminilitoris]|uniref:Lipoprotein n=1 Tax=Kangiella sediminilitoris TaxID=1144748 RepID=A0A1B3BD32_9GAMM|nr:hypothetical protein [Kangiella sediminilitoris]AOE50637.1 hypothetical protein KS2013_1928 [Kangiella sediminilitoris]